MAFFRFGLLFARRMGKAYSKSQSILNEKILTGKPDLYDGISIKSCENKFNKKLAKKVLQNSFNKWKKENIHSVWFEIKIEVKL